MSNLLSGLFSKAKPDAEAGKKNILLVPTSDWHIGGTTALHPNVRKNTHGEYVPLTELGGWLYSDRPIFYPSALQVKIWNHFEKCLDVIADQRIDKTLVILFGGDTHDGFHHNTSQLVTVHISEQTETHIETMEYMQHRLGFARGDLLVYVQGTDVHVGIEGEKIAKQLNAYQYLAGNYCAAFLKLELNGVYIWSYHKGVSAGQGVTRGDACVRKMKQIYYQCLQEGSQCPDLIITAHTHDYYHATWTTPSGKIMQYIILASFQDKTRFVTDNMATNINKVGMGSVLLTTDSRVIVNPPMLMTSPLGESIKL